jgi:hypothetical protein
LDDFLVLFFAALAVFAETKTIFSGCAGTSGTTSNEQPIFAEIRSSFSVTE